MHRLLAALGDPHRSLRVVHVAGSKGARARFFAEKARYRGIARRTGKNPPSSPRFHPRAGKGSTVAMLVSALSAAGFRVGAYTSPHLAHLRERIRVDDPAGAAAAPSDAAPAGARRMVASRLFLRFAPAKESKRGQKVDALFLHSSHPLIPTPENEISLLSSSAGPSDPGASAALLPGVISPAAWHRLCSSSAAAVDAAQRKEGGALTHFEVVTALALRHFAESGVDCAVIEARALSWV